MKLFGIAFFVLGLVLLGYGFTMDTSIAFGLGGMERIHNIGLLNQRQSLLIVGGVLLLAGSVLLGFASRNSSNGSADQRLTRKCPQCAEVVKSEAKVCRFCGYEMDMKPEPMGYEASEAARNLRLAGYQVGALGEDKWRVVHKSRQVLEYPASSEELAAVAKRELSRPSQSEA